MFDTARIRLRSAQMTQFSGTSLSETLYTIPLTVCLTGPLGAGKTKFLRGFAQGMGIHDSMTSPTYALEQRYSCVHWGEVLHIDLYRLEGAAAKEIITASDDHPGIRCIEWSDRVEGLTQSADIHIHLEDVPEYPQERDLTITFRDIALPSLRAIEEWRREIKLPKGIVDHCNAVADFALRTADALLQEGHIVRREALKRAAQLHDLLRFMDFPEDDQRSEDAWKPWNEEYASMRHEAACAALLNERGFPAIAQIVETHGLNTPNPPKMTIEQQLLFYADKRVGKTTVMSLDDRFEDFLARYRDLFPLEENQRWLNEAKRIEQELFPDGPPL